MFVHPTNSIMLKFFLTFFYNFWAVYTWKFIWNNLLPWFCFTSFMYSLPYKHQTWQNQCTMNLIIYCHQKSCCLHWLQRKEKWQKETKHYLLKCGTLCVNKSFQALLLKTLRSTVSMSSWLIVHIYLTLHWPHNNDATAII